MNQNDAMVAHMLHRKQQTLVQDLAGIIQRYGAGLSPEFKESVNRALSSFKLNVDDADTDLMSAGVGVASVCDREIRF